MSKPKIEETHLRGIMLFLFDQGKKAKEAIGIICETYGPILTLDKCHRWFKKFKSGDRGLNNAPKSGRPSKLDDDILKSAVEADPRKTIKELSAELGCPWTTVKDHLKRIGKKHRQGLWVPHELSQTAIEQRMTICSSLLSRHETGSFLRRIITSDEKWVLYNNPKRKNQWLSSNQVPLPTPKPSLTLKKVLLCVWWDMMGIIHYELLKPGETVTAEVYCGQLARMKKELQKKRSVLVNNQRRILQHDNARPHSAKMTLEKIKELDLEVLQHPPYSPDIAPSDYHLFRSLEHSIRNKNFETLEGVKKHLESFFNDKPVDFFRRGIEKLPVLWGKVIENNGNYFTD
ncbi:MAG: hypothetical protein ACRDD0_08680 [Bacteroidales bacterium]